MRGIPISKLTSKSVTRGFYVTKGDIETTMAAYTTPDYLTSTTEFSMENETTLLPLDTDPDVTESIPKEISTKSMTTLSQVSTESSSENASVFPKFTRTTPLATTVNVVEETTKNYDLSSINNDSFTKPTRKTRGRVRYTDATTPLHHRVRSRIRSTTKPNYSNVDVSSTLKNNVVSTEKSTTTLHEALQSSTNLMADTIVSSTRNVERKTTPLDYTLQTEADTTIPETSTSMITIFEVETTQPESSTVRTTFQTTLEAEEETDANKIIFDKIDELASTVTFNYATEHEITTTRHGLTTPTFETTTEMTTPMKETENTETINVRTTTTSYATTENTDTLYDITTAMPELDNTIVPKSSPHIEQTTAFSKTTQFPTTSSSNPPPSDNSSTTEETREENIPRKRQRFNNQFGQRIRGNGYRRVVQRKEIEDKTSTQELDNSKPIRRQRVRVYRTRQRKPNPVSSSTEVNNFVSIDDSKLDIAEEQKRRLKLGERRLKVNRNEYIEETVSTEQYSLLDTTLPTLVTEEYTERPVNEGTVSKGSGLSSGRTKPGTSILVNRLRNVNGSSQSSSVVTRPSTVIGDNRKSRPSGTSTVSPTATIVDAFEDATVSSPEQSVKDEDDRAEISDQNGRAQELAVTLADPPTSQSSDNTGRLPLRDTLRRRISTTVAPRTDFPSSTSSFRLSTVSRNRQRPTSTTRKEGTTRSSTSRPRRPTIIDYDYYEDEETPIVEKSMYNGKLFLTSKGTIKCLDQGNFPHPYSCKKFITCARIVNGLVIGAEYTCPDKLSFDPVGGICNWSAGLGCKE